jgi:hypothetical protein
MLHGGFNKDVPPERMIATAMGDLRLIKPHEEIRDAVQFKGSRYGAMTAAVKTLTVIEGSPKR